MQIVLTFNKSLISVCRQIIVFGERNKKNCLRTEPMFCSLRTACLLTCLTNDKTWSFFYQKTVLNIFVRVE